jgi:hypothetical protein
VWCCNKVARIRLCAAPSGVPSNFSRANGNERRAHAVYTRLHQLSQLLGARYQHVQGLGNRNYKSGSPIALADYEAGKAVIAELLATGQSVILLCVCIDVATCHRRTAAEQLAADLGETITHLMPPKKLRAQDAQERLFE